MKILIADKFPENKISELKANGVEVICDPALKEETLVAALKKENPSLIIVRSTKVTEKMILASEQLVLVVRAGAGVNTIDLQAASEHGVFVANCPGKNAVAVAELALGLILALDRQIPANTQALRERQWNKKLFSKTKGLKGRTLGVLGVGNIGIEVANRAKAFDMEVIAWSRSLTEEKAEALGIRRVNSPLELAEQSDIVTVHLALSDDTRGMCDKAFFSAMKEGAFFINTSRAAVVDEEALIEAMDLRGIRAGLDVFENEPATGECEWQSKLSAHTSVIGSHHIGASTEQAQNAIADEAIRIIDIYRTTGQVINCVNLDKESSASAVLNVRHFNEVGVLAGVLDAIRKENINVLEMENALFAGEKAAIARIALNKAPGQKTLDKIAQKSSAIISLTLSSTG